MMKNILISLIVTMLSINGLAQESKKSINAAKLTIAPKIDGILDDEAWKNVDEAKDFILYEPYNGKLPSKNTSVIFTYDNTALYIAARMHDSAPDSILTEFAKRDATDINADFIEIVILPYNDGQNAFSFQVYASGVQTDFKKSYINGNDYSWNAVWQSEVSIDNKGWVAEIKIPFSAIRFAKKEIQLWGINIKRSDRRLKEKSSWNFIDVKKNNELGQCGELQGIKSIDPPPRLSFSPYFSNYLEKPSGANSWNNSLNYGMDLKFGFNESFTLDISLIPDFGQVQSDDQVYNLSPFEVMYNEKRQFFTESIELFKRCNVFYSRRIGNRPDNYYSIEDSLKASEEIDKNPSENKVINVTKISGRTKKGLGIGFLNAMTSNTYATLIDSSGNKRDVLSQPFTNYNMLVLDQSLKYNSYISFVNTNVWNENYSANVSGTEFGIFDKKQKYRISGKGVISQNYVKNKKTDLGHNYQLIIAKVSGNFQYSYENYVESDTYDPNDLGFNIRNNEFINKAIIKYNIYKPFWKVYYWHNNLTIKYECLYAPRKYTGFKLDFNTMTLFKNHFTAGFIASFKPIGTDDYFESRTAGRVYKKPSDIYYIIWLSPDYRKKFIVDANFTYFSAHNDARDRYVISLRPRLRINDKFVLSHNLNYKIEYNDMGYVSTIENTSFDDDIVLEQET